MDMDTATTTARPEKAHGSRLGYLADKIAVKSEPGLTSAQLMVRSASREILERSETVLTFSIYS